jgi:hypothetical protein
MLGAYLPASNGWNVYTSAISSDDLRVALLGFTNPAPVGSGIIVNLPFNLLTDVNPDSLTIGINKNSDPHEDQVTWTPINTGDVNLDGHVNVADIFAMESALTNLSQYQSIYGLTNQEMLYILDVNRDGSINNGDLQALINQLLSGGGSFSTEGVAQSAAVAAPVAVDAAADTGTSEASTTQSQSSKTSVSSTPEVIPPVTDDTLTANNSPPPSDNLSVPAVSQPSVQNVTPVDSGDSHPATHTLIASLDFALNPLADYPPSDVARHEYAISSPVASPTSAAEPHLIDDFYTQFEQLSTNSSPEKKSLASDDGATADDFFADLTLNYDNHFLGKYR